MFLTFHPYANVCFLPWLFLGTRQVYAFTYSLTSFYNSTPVRPVSLRLCDKYGRREKGTGGAAVKTPAHTSSRRPPSPYQTGLALLPPSLAFWWSGGWCESVVTRRKEMKFGKRLKRQIEETLPEWRDKFLSYKDLKKMVRLISVPPAQPRPPHGKAEEDFIHLLNAEVEKFNAFFIEQEEDFIIRQKELQDRICSVKETVGPDGKRPSAPEYASEMGKIRKVIVDLHGEMVLLVNYSNINYTGLAKILKKYDKRTGALLRLPFIEKVLKQPFFTTELISKLVKECENTMDAVFPVAEEDQDSAEGRNREAVGVAEQSILRNAIAALVTMQELRRGSSTYGHFSLPPMNLPDTDLIQSLQLPSPIPIL